MCSFEGTILLLKDRGLVKWYDRGLQNLWWEFDSLIPCNEMRKAFKMAMSLTLAKSRNRKHL